MISIEWTDDLSVGIDLIDRQHKILVRAINLLAMAVEKKTSDQLLTEIFATLVDYTDTHFAYEEELFDIYGYPHTEEHKLQHRHLLQRVTDLKHKWENGETNIGPEVLRFLVDWLKTHILGSDKKYSAFLIQALSSDQRRGA